MIIPKIIGLAGPAGCGKDTVAQLLATHAGFAQLAFADALRNEICNAFGVDYTLFSRRDLKEQPTPHLAFERCSDHAFTGLMLRRLAAQPEPRPAVSDHLAAYRSPRQLMRLWGTEYRRDTCGPEYWTRTLKARVHIQQQGQQWRHVISDVRYHNEAEAVRSMGGTIWQIKRPDLLIDTSHTSEVDGSAFAPDVVINNCHDLRHLQMVVLGAWVKCETGLQDFDLVDMGKAFSTEAAAA